MPGESKESYGFNRGSMSKNCSQRKVKRQRLGTSGSNQNYERNKRSALSGSWWLMLVAFVKQPTSYQNITQQTENNIFIRNSKEALNENWKTSVRIKLELH